ncbi:PP2C family serine/threonine-protein phosphatase [Thioalkalivibrio sp. ALJ16]|uniref:PP2C family protein-serine/threonine phosphatase n=1 Tax=Thioalkalivibrio sp. ALJ16 TaxID=1158762 RepID=UPI00037C2E77|nr:protein phosphatase 2C domain-containing protein [Thioalkalivibrio sp. ALJ16]
MKTAHARDVGGRAEQQDQAATFAAPDGSGWLLLVADGMGGHQGGAAAAAEALRTAERLWRGCDGRPSHPQDFLKQLFHQTQSALWDPDAAPERRPGTTLVALYSDGERAWWAHCGDSRLYHFEGDTLRQRTRDHTRVQQLVDAGMIREEDAATHPDQNRLMQALGAMDAIRVEYGSAVLTRASRFLLCSDGFWSQILPVEMATLLEAPDPGRHLPRLVAEAARRGGPRGDNVAAAILWPEGASSGRAYRRPMLLGLVLLVALAILFWPLD